MQNYICIVTESLIFEILSKIFFEISELRYQIREKKKSGCKQGEYHYHIMSNM